MAGISTPMLSDSKAGLVFVDCDTDVTSLVLCQYDDNSMKYQKM